MAKPQHDIYRGYTLTVDERRAAATKIAAARGIKYKSALRAIQRATTTARQRIKTNRFDVQGAISDVAEKRETAPGLEPGYVFYWQDRRQLKSGDHIVEYVDDTISNRESALSSAQSWADGEKSREFSEQYDAHVARTRRQAEDEGLDGDEAEEEAENARPWIKYVTVQYVAPRIVDKLVQRKTKTKAAQYEQEEIIGGYRRVVSVVYKHESR